MFPVNSECNLPDIFTTGTAVTRDTILALEQSMNAECTNELADYDFCLKHYHAPGVYARELFIPKGMVIVGKIHKHSHHNNISMGKIAVATEFGSYVIEAPHSFVSVPGTKRAVYALEDTMWTTYHAVGTDNLEDIEDEVIARSYADFDNFAKAMLEHSSEV